MSKRDDNKAIIMNDEINILFVISSTPMVVFILFYVPIIEWKVF